MEGGVGAEWVTDFSMNKVDICGTFCYTSELVECEVEFDGIQGTLFQSMSSPKESELPQDIPLVIEMSSKQHDYSSKHVNAIWMYCNLKIEDDTCDVLVLKKLVARRNFFKQKQCSLGPHKCFDGGTSW